MHNFYKPGEELNVFSNDRTFSNVFNYKFYRYNLKLLRIEFKAIVSE